MNFVRLQQHLNDILGLPYYSDDNCSLFCVDSLKTNTLLSSELFNLVITSPPYNIGKEYEDILPIEEYVSWTKIWTKEICRLLLKNGAFLYNLGYVSLEDRGRAIPLPYLLWNEIPLYLNQEIVWNYSAGVACKNYLSPRNEKFLWYVKDKNNYTFNLDNIRDPNVKYPNSKRNGKSRVNPLGKNPSDVWEIAKVTTGRDRSPPERTAHPAQFPIELINRLVLGFSNKHDIIFDPFVGSGTTIVTSIDCGRYCVGFEIRQDYCEIAKKRILSYYEQESQISVFEMEQQHVA